MLGYFVIVLFVMVNGVQSCPNGCTCQGSPFASTIQCSDRNLYLKDWEQFLTYYVEELSITNYRMREQDVTTFFDKFPNLNVLILTNTRIACSNIISLQTKITNFYSDQNCLKTSENPSTFLSKLTTKLLVTSSIPYETSTQFATTIPYETSTKFAATMPYETSTNFVTTKTHIKTHTPSVTTYTRMHSKISPVTILPVETYTQTDLIDTTHHKSATTTHTDTIKTHTISIDQVSKQIEENTVMNRAMLSIMILTIIFLSIHYIATAYVKTRSKLRRRQARRPTGHSSRNNIYLEPQALQLRTIHEQLNVENLPPRRFPTFPTSLTNQNFDLAYASVSIPRQPSSRFPTPPPPASSSHISLGSFSSEETLPPPPPPIANKPRNLRQQKYMNTTSLFDAEELESETTM